MSTYASILARSPDAWNLCPSECECLVGLSHLLLCLHCHTAVRTSHISSIEQSHVALVSDSPGLASFLYICSKLYDFFLLQTLGYF